MYHVPVKNYVRSLEAKVPYEIPMIGGIVNEVNSQFPNWTNTKNLRERLGDCSEAGRTSSFREKSFCQVS
jgi:hypothetical protein